MLDKKCLKGFAATALVAGFAWGFAGCPDPEPDGDDLFRVAISGVPGGSLLAAWGTGESGPIFIAGGMVGVDPARLAGTGLSAGRLVEYTPGRFTTRCRVDATLWWVHGIARPGATPEVWASGEDGAVLRYRDGRCETLPLGITFAEGRPTLWGIWAQRPDDVWFVGGSAQPTGPRGVLLHYDGSTFERIEGLPAAARDENLYKIARSGDRYVIVGSAGTVLVGDGRSFEGVDAGITSGDNRLFTASCSDLLCVAVGGVASGLVLTSTTGPSGLRVASQFEGSIGLNGVWARDPVNVFVVGVGGFTMHMQRGGVLGFRSYSAPSRTQATLHGVGGNGSVVVAVGGELDDRSTMQRGVALVRGDDAAAFTFDGRTYNAAGTLRRSLGGSGQ